ncbi:MULTISPECIES: PP2C family protein-serine/threonine phosphatase [unclassified Pseudoalteromonas]|uniref:PP2C family protein-serine/threonine phosphatase n=1 Tax=unclassified Pseudoalteromonas TaxID=194690 RepID=UPI0030151A69
MEQDAIKIQIKDWLCRKTARAGCREILGLPVAIGSDIGSVREENQDKAVILRAQVSSSKFFLVGVLCDGMGGMSEGADCASLAVASFISSCIRNRNLQVKERLLQGVELANKDVFQKYNGEGGATLSAFILDSDGHFEAVNVGDSRLYTSCDGALKQISVDDTIAGQLNHQSSPSQLSNKLLQYIGIGDDIEPHLLNLSMPNEVEKVLLTSDGVHYLESNTLSSIITQNITPLELSKRLIYVAKWCGGHDNSTVIALSDLASFYNSAEKIKTGTVQLWDAFGDVQLIGIEKNQPTEPKKVPSDDEPLSSGTEEVEKSGSDKEKKPVHKRHKRKKTGKDELDNNTKKPQLRIDFDD